MTGLRRCGWVPVNDSLYQTYHDHEWGVPSHDEHHLFEMLILEGMQAGLSWATILHKREYFRAAFARFHPDKVARFTQKDVDYLLLDQRIVRNRRKIEAAITNARVLLDLYDCGNSLNNLLWSFRVGQPAVNHWRNEQEIPVWTPQSEQLSRYLKQLGFRFIGPTICYAYMQAVGLVNDHVIDCFRHPKRTG